MPAFTKKVKTNGGDLLVFNFHRIYTVEGLNYFISFVDRHESYHFKMKQVEGCWKIIAETELPNFIPGLETELAEAIEEHLKENTK